MGDGSKQRRGSGKANERATGKRAHSEKELEPWKVKKAKNDLQSAESVVNYFYQVAKELDKLSSEGKEDSPLKTYLQNQFYLGKADNDLKLELKDADHEMVERSYGTLVDGDDWKKKAASGVYVGLSYNGKPIWPRKPRELPIILPFDANVSQLEAIEAALNKRLSVIQGPPGTGKTQTILNLVANLLIRDMTVLIASPNNEATANVAEKLRYARKDVERDLPPAAEVKKLEKDLLKLYDPNNGSQSSNDSKAAQVEIIDESPYQAYVSGGYGFLLAALGNSRNRNLFGAHVPDYPADFESWKRSKKRLSELADEINGLRARAEEVYKAQRRLQKDQERLQELEREQHYYRELCEETFALLGESMPLEGGDLKVRSTGAKSVEALRADRDRVRKKAEAGESKVSFIDKVKGRFLDGVGVWADYKMPAAVLEMRLNLELFKAEIAWTEERIEGAKSVIKGREATDLLSSLKGLSGEYLRATLYAKFKNDYQYYKATGGRIGINYLDADSNEYYKPYKDNGKVFESIRIVTSTTNAARKQRPWLPDDYRSSNENTAKTSNSENSTADSKSTKGPKPFDYVIIDESSQADVVTGYLALGAARNAVVVGDTKQLPCVVTDQQKEAAGKHPLPMGQVKVSGSSKWKEEVLDQYDYRVHSLLSSIECINDKARSQGKKPVIPVTTLREHYRCAPKIIGFCNQEFYDGELITMTEDTGDTNSLSVYRTGVENHARKGNVNAVQAETVGNLVDAWSKAGVGSSDIGVATPYRKQIGRVNDELEGRGLDAYVQTVHKFQGREQDCVIFDTVANDAQNDFIDERMVNVAVSRAVNRLAVIGSDHIFDVGVASAQKDPSGPVASLYNYIVYQGGEVNVSDVALAFPLIYGDEEERELYLEERGARPDDYVTEVKANEDIKRAIDELMKEMPEMAALGVMRNYPLHLLIPRTCKVRGLLSVDEEGLIDHGGHVDFAIYERASKQLIGAIEIDGSQHQNDSEQKERDARKDRIFRELGIPLMRIPTYETEAHEMEAIHRLLRQALSEHGERRFQKWKPVVIDDGDSYTIDDDSDFYAE